MKNAAASDARRAISKRSKQCSIIKRITVRGLLGFENFTIEPNSGFVVVCGGTGVGKSAFLRVLALALRPAMPNRPLCCDRRLGKFEVSIHIENANTQFQRNLKVGEAPKKDSLGYKPEALLVSLYDRTDDLISAFEEYKSDFITEGYAAKEFSLEQIRLVSSTVGKAYSKIVVYEVEDELNTDKILPYFQATEGQVTYDLTEMGAGELSAIYITWFMEYIQRRSIVMIEEPEALLPPTGHLGILNVICKGALKKEATVILSTHSAEIVSEVPLQQLISLTRIGYKTRCPMQVKSKDDILNSLGLKIPTTCIILVEDSLAFFVTREIIARFDNSMLHRVEISSVGTGFGAIKNAIEHMPNVRSFSIIGLVDGDMKEELEKWNQLERCCILPFDVGMESEFLSCVREDSQNFSDLAGRHLEDIEAGLSLVVGQDPHDGFRSFGTRIGLSIERLSGYCFQHWINTRHTEKSCKNLAETLRDKLKIK